MSEEKAILERRRKEREEQHLYLPCSVITEESFKAYQGFDLASWDLDPNLETSPKYYRTLRASTVADFCAIIAADNGVPSDHIRLWIMVNRQNKTVRPDQPILDPNMTVEEACSKYGSRDKYFRLWAEVANHVEEGRPIWPDLSSAVGNNIPVLVFLKYFDPHTQTLRGVGHLYPKKHSKVSDLVPQIQQMMGWSPAHMPIISLYEVCKKIGLFSVAHRTNSP